jgi:hypothetical protein
MTASGTAHGSDRSAGGLLVPITLALSPIRRLLVIDVADDPTYRALEPQVLDGPGGSGLLLLAYRHDGPVEIFAEAGLQVEPSGYEGLGEGLLGIHHAAFESACFEVTGDGLLLDVALTADDGRRFDLHLHEHLRGPRDRVPVLAPVGGAFETPAFFPFVWLPGLSFVPVRGSEVVVRVDGEQRTVARLPLPLGGRRCLMARYDPEVMVCELNPDGVTELPRTPARRGAGRSRPDGVDVVEVDGRPAIAGVRVHRDGHTCAVLLDPPLPDLEALPRSAPHAGALRLQADGTTELSARYELTRTEDRIDLVVRAFGPWRTRQRRPLLAVLFRLPIFRRWPTSYSWEATLDLAAGPEARWTSRWSRRPGA